MRRRSKGGGEPFKSRHRKTVVPKRRNSPETGVRRGSSATDRDAEVARLSQELDEALEQQTATSEVVRVMASRRGALPPVSQAMLDSAPRICDAIFGSLYLRGGDVFRLSAMHNRPPALVQARGRMPFRPEVKTA